MAKTKISEFSATANSNTDINSINIAEGCAPSNINDAIRELMAELKDFQAGTKGDSFNGPVGTSTAAAGAFTTLSASSTVSGTGFSTYLASPPAIGGTAPAAGAFTTLSSTGNTTLGDASGDTVTINGTTTFVNVNPTLSAGTANGVLYLNGSKVATSGSALTFTGTRLGIGETSPVSGLTVKSGNGDQVTLNNAGERFTQLTLQNNGTSKGALWVDNTNSLLELFGYSGMSLTFSANGSEQMRLTSTGLGIGTSSPQSLLNTASTGQVQIGTSSWPTNFIGKSNARTIIGNEGVLILWNEAAATAGNEAALYIGPKGSGTNGSTIIAGGYVKGISESSSTNNGALTFGTNGGGGNSEKMRLDSSGNLGLGVTPSAWSLGKALQIGTSGAASLLGYNNSFYLTANAYYDGSWKYTATAAAGRYQLESGVHSWSIAASGTAGNAITFTQAMTLDASGNWFLGATSSAAGKAVIKDNSSGNNLWLIGRSSDGTSSISFRNNADSAYNARIECFDTGVMTFGTGTSATERARITSTGDLYINTTSAIDSAYKVQLYFASGGGITIKTGTNGDNAMGFRNSSGTSVGSIVINASSTAYNTSSDYRLKNTIAPMTGALAKVAQLKPCTYKWNADGSDGEGFIAHELAEVVPQCVTGAKDAVDADGNPVYQGIDTSFLVATLTAAIQELKAEVDSLKAQLNKGA